MSEKLGDIFGLVLCHCFVSGFHDFFSRRLRGIGKPHEFRLTHKFLRASGLDYAALQTEKLQVIFDFLDSCIMKFINRMQSLTIIRYSYGPN